MDEDETRTIPEAPAGRPGDAEPRYVTVVQGRFDGRDHRELLRQLSDEARARKVLVEPQ